MKKILKLSACVILSVTAILFSIAAYAAIVTADASFDINKLSSPSDTNEYFDQSGKIIESANKNEPVKIRLENLPAHVKYAFIAIEDKRFYRHRGVDIKRMAAAALKNVKNKGFKEGASTISQQLIKNTHLSNEKTLKRKLKEIKLTLKLEKSLTKDQILEAYLNTIYFGEGAYGIERAARTYFYKSAAELDLHESATLAAVIKAPSVYSPFLNPDKTAERRNLVLKRMREQKYITENDYSSEIGKPLGAIRDDSANAYSYMNCAKREAEEIISSLPLGYYESYDIYTYLDAELNELLQNETKERPVKSNYLAVLTDNISHGVTALSSDVYEIKRCPASTVKPWLVYAPAIYENEISLATKILDEQTDFNGFYPCNNKGVYHGYVSVKEALSKSLNVPSVKVANCLGLKKMKDYAAKMNIELEGGLGVAIGGIDDGMTLREICDCYSVFSGKGCFTESKFIKKITLKNGKTVYERAASSKKVFDEATAFIVNDALKECAENGTAKKISIKNLNLYAKTGTNGNTDGNFDAYTVSFTPEYTLGVW
ncbi:MAG: transglycosylase domain-containing protein, partial [Clostridia bacterium]|nr:transglycosylase domain-containing protein [Clostridia bacterium]